MKSTKARSAKASPKPRSSARAAPKKAAPKKAAKAAPKKVAKAASKKVVKAAPKKVAKAASKKVAKTAPKKVVKAASKKVAKTAPKKPTTRRRVGSPAPASPPPGSERVPLTPLVRTAISGIGSSGVAARGPADPELRPGDDLPALSRRPVTRVDVARYCAASGDFNVIALDEPRAREAGLPAVVVPGGLAFALAEACVRAWLGQDGRVFRSGARLVKMVWPDDELVARARVSEVRQGTSGREVELDVWVENQKGELVLRGQSTCAVGASGRGQ